MSQSKKKRTSSQSVDKAPSSQLVAKERRGKWTPYIIVAIFVALIVVVLLFTHYFSEDQRNLRLTVITVDDTTLRMDTFIERTRLAGADPMTMLEALTKELLIKLEAPQYVGEVSLEDIDQQLRAIARGQSETISESEFKEWYRQQLNETGLSDAKYREITTTGILGARLQLYLAERLSTVAEHVHLHAIVVKTYDEAEEVRARWEAGEDFADLAREVSLDEVTGENGGDLGWLPGGVMTDTFDYVAFSLTPGEVSEPVPYVSDPSSPEDMAYYLFMVSEKATRELDENSLQVLRSTVLEEWLIARMEFHEIKYNFNSEIYAWINWQLSKNQPSSEGTGGGQ